MGSLVRRWWSWMVFRSQEAHSIWRVIGWWELRRLSYNLFLAAVGIPSLIVFFLAISAAHELQPGEDAVEPMALFAAPILANIAYTAGWVVEGALLWRRSTQPRGPRLMRFGVLFSLFVILLPAVAWTIVALIRLV
jgi:hypothetical protein